MNAAADFINRRIIKLSFAKSIACGRYQQHFWCYATQNISIFRARWIKTFIKIYFGRHAGKILIYFPPFFSLISILVKTSAVDYVFHLLLHIAISFPYDGVFIKKDMKFDHVALFSPKKKAPQTMLLVEIALDIATIIANGVNKIHPQMHWQIFRFYIGKFSNEIEALS